MKAIVLHSGGLDSTVCLLQAIEAGRDVVSLGIDYGQRHRVELLYAAEQCRSRGIERRVLRVEWTKAPRMLPENRTIQEMRSSVSPAFLAGRNAVFLTLACADAAGSDAHEVWLGVNSVEFSGYPDCTPQFVDAFRAMIEVAIPGGPKVITPLLHLDKPQIAAEGARLGLTPGATWSCYQPKFSDLGISPCGVCDACILHDHAWATV